MTTSSSDLKPWRFKLLYDGECPFCQWEAKWLGHLGRDGSLLVEDICAAGFEPAEYDATLEQLMGSIHGVFPDGRQTKGLETFRQAYRAVGLGWVFAPTGWPVLRWGFDAAYYLFAHYRVPIGRLFGRRECDGNRCAVRKG